PGVTIVPPVALSGAGRPRASSGCTSGGRPFLHRPPSSTGTAAPWNRRCGAGTLRCIGTVPTPGPPALRKDTAMRDIQTIIMGNATANPTLVRQEDGTVSAKVRVAVTGRYYNASQQDYADRKTEFITVFVRRQLARNVMLSVR